MRLVLLRHGRTEANERYLYCGSSDPSLSAMGKVALMALRLKREINADGLVRITSGMRRTDETLWLLFDCAPDHVEPDLREINFGEFEMRSYEELKPVPAYQRWISDEAGETAPPGGESAKIFQARVIAAADRLTEDSLIIAHGGVIAVLMAHWFPEEGKNCWDWQPDFGCGYEVMLEGVHRSYRAI